MNRNLSPIFTVNVGENQRHAGLTAERFHALLNKLTTLGLLNITTAFDANGKAIFTNGHWQI